MLKVLDRALHPDATRPGLLQPGEVFEALMQQGRTRFGASDLATLLCRPVDQVLHVVSYMTSLGLLAAHRDNGRWTYELAKFNEAWV
ncbi:MAG: hypothetical protein VKN33_02120 [Candidatus Sericytochromatia bacterium]|nr:hypothetical protein [Candidatus Sericytochromatia bacterium]